MNPWVRFDRVELLHPNRSARALLQVPLTLSLFDTHFPRFPVLPGVLALDNLSELAAHLLERKTGRPWRFRRASQVRWRRYVRPGDVMELEVDLKGLTAEQGLLGGTGRVDGRLVLTVRELELLPTERRKLP